MPTLRDLFRTTIMGQPASPSSPATSPYSRVTPQLASPFTQAQLQAIVWADVTGGTFGPMTRDVAIQVPAVARLRHLLVGIIARLPLLDLQGDVQTPNQPPWMQRTDGDLPPWHRMAWTVDDCLFYGWSLWAAKRGFDGELLATARVPYDQWDVDPDGFIKVDQQNVQAGQAILITGPHGGLLNESSTIIRLSADNIQAAANAARNPNPNVDLHYTGEENLDDTEIAALIKIWADARQGLNGGVGFTNRLVEAKTLGSHLDKLLIEGRNADAVDIARAGSVPAASLDATNAGASLTYETTEGRNQELLDYGAQMYMDAIAARLSQDDCVPRGHRSAFDTSQFTTLTPTPTGAPTSD